MKTKEKKDVVIEEINFVFKSNVKSLFEEVIDNGGIAVQAASMPLKITYQILLEVAKRASELNDDKLNALMCRLSLYSVADQYSEDFDAGIVSKTLDKVGWK